MNVQAFVDSEDIMRVSVDIPDADEQAPPMDLVCIIDISASMGGRAACQTDGHTEYEDLGFSILDLVRHAVKTVVSVMRPQDRISLVLFDDRIEVPYGFTELNEDKRKEILSFCSGMRNRGSTNIYDALMKGINLIKERPKTEQNNAAIMFFTDGQPNSGRFIAKDQIVTNIVQYAVEKNFQYPIHTYAFGQYTSCTSDLMFQVASSFNGMFGYIQDAKTLGTIFTNGIAYTLCSAAKSVVMKVEMDGKCLVPNHEFLSIKMPQDEEAIELSGLRYGQSADLLFDMKDTLKKDSKLKITVASIHKGKLECPVVREVQIQKCQMSENLDHKLRFDTIRLFKKIIAEFKGQNAVEEL